MKTLYYEDIYLLDFEAEIIEITKQGDNYHVVLNQTAFYPNSGGMPADKGTLNNIPVIDVIKKDEEVIHILESNLEDTKVIGKVDYETRISNIQFHDAQHLLTAIFEKDYQLLTVSHHVHNNYCDLVFEGESLTQEMIDEVEKISNQMIFDQTPMDLFYLPKKDLAKHNIKDHPKYSDPVRITNIIGLDDFNACGCLHFDNLSKIQGVKCLGFEKTKNQFKLFFTAGLKMIKYFDMQNNIIKDLKVLAKANEENMIDKITTIIEKNSSLTKELNDCKKTIYSQLVTTLIENDIIIYHEPDNNMNNLKVLAQEIINYETPIIALLQIEKDDKYQFLLVKQKESDVSLEDIFTNLKNDLNITGGGKGLTINGQATIDLSKEIKKYL